MHDGYGYSGGGHHPRDPRAGPLHGGPSGMGDLPPDYQWSMHGPRVKSGSGPQHRVSPAPQPEGYGQGLTQEQCALIESLDEVMSRRAVVRSELAPHSTEPYRATTLQLYRRFVIVPAAADDADANQGGIASGVAAISFVTAPPEQTFLVFTNTAGATLPPSHLVASFRVPRGYVAVLNHFQTWVHNWVARTYMRWRIDISQSPSIDNLELAEFTGAGEHGRVFGVAHENEAVRVLAAHHDARTGVMAHCLLTGWFFPVAQLDDSLASLFLGNERGPRTRRFQSGC